MFHNFSPLGLGFNLSLKNKIARVIDIKNIIVEKIKNESLSAIDIPVIIPKLIVCNEK
jgi:hypothetical protein